MGVWAGMLLLILGYCLILSRIDDSHESSRLQKGRRAAFVLAIFLLWASLDWPLGPLGASYLASVHMVQFLSVGIAAPALLLLAFPTTTYEPLRRRPRLTKVLSDLTHPITAFFIFNIVMTVTHWPGVVDLFMPTQLGSFALDATWMLGGVIFWWPLIVPVPERPGFHSLGKIAYLALNAFLIRPPFAMMIFSKSPIYAIYELAPPPARDALNDQQLAGAVMKIGSAWIMFAGVLFVFRIWMLSESDRPESA